MRKVLLASFNLLLFLAISCAAFSQTLDNQVISIGGGHADTPNGNQLDWTVGEAIIGSLEIQDRLITQGFHQPYLIDCSFDIEAKVTCLGSDEFVVSVSPNSNDEVLIKNDESTSFSGEYVFGPFANNERFSSEFYTKNNPACSKKVEINEINCKEQNFQLLNFNGHLNAKSNTLNWLTFGELTSGVIELQRSVDGVNYTAIHTYDSDKEQYAKTFNDPVSEESGLVFYKVVAFDKAGQEKASKDLALTRVNELADIDYEVEVYPNPVIDNLFIYLKDYDQSEVIISLFSLSGSTIKSLKLPVVDRKVSINVTDLDIATYLISIVTKDGKLITTKKIQKFD